MRKRKVVVGLVMVVMILWLVVCGSSKRESRIVKIQ